MSLEGRLNGKSTGIVGNLTTNSGWNLREIEPDESRSAMPFSRFLEGHPASPRQIPRSLPAKLWQSFSAKSAMPSATTSENGRLLGMTIFPFISEDGTGTAMSEFGMTFSPISPEYMQVNGVVEEFGPPI